MECEKFWLEHPLSLFTDFNILPEKSMCTDSKLNAATRLVLVISAVLFFSKIDQWYVFMLASILFICLLKYAFCRNKEGFTEIPLQPLNPLLRHCQETPIDAIDSHCDGDFEMLQSEDGETIVNDVEYIDDEYRPRRYFGVSQLMPHEEDQNDYDMDRRELQFLNTNRYAERICEARDATTYFVRREIEDRFGPDEYFESCV